MLSDIQKLVKYQEALEELHDLKRELNEVGSYDNVSVRFSPTVIYERWSNSEGKNAKTYEFSFTQIDDIRERIRKKSDYRKKKLGESKK